MVVDALSSWVVEPAIEKGQLPHFKALAEKGHISFESITAFPSITPAATASIITGCYPAEHGIAGAFWFDESKEDIAYYGDDMWVILQRGFSDFFRDFLLRLNGDRLHVPTGFEICESQGLTTGCLNYLWFRGKTKHEARIPGLLNLIPGVSRTETVLGPELLFLGDFVASSTSAGEKQIESAKRNSGIFHRYGFEDQTTSNELIGLAEQGQFPDFTLAYFPDNDYESHEKGPEEAVTVLESFDSTLGRLIDVCGGLDQFLDEYAVVITGDHSQSQLDDKDPDIRLDEELADFSIAKTGEPWTDGDEIMICPNMRAAQIYVRDDDNTVRERVVARLLENDRVDQVLIASDSSSPENGSHLVKTRDRGELLFRRSNESQAMAVDHYGNNWSWEGDLAAVDASLNGETGTISYGNYPNALERIATGFSSESGDLWITAALGYEFSVKETSVHGGGSHGSLHALDSTSPILLSGAPEGVSLPEHPRSIDILPICLEILGLETQDGSKAMADQAEDGFI